MVNQAITEFVATNVEAVIIGGFLGLVIAIIMIVFSS